MYPFERLCAQCSTKTITNRLRQHGSSVRHHVDDDLLREAIQELCYTDEHGRAAGHRMVQAALFGRAGLRASRLQILEVLRAADPAAMAGRQERLLPRRTYTLEEAMLLWHMDSETARRASWPAACSTREVAVGGLKLECVLPAAYEKLKMFGLFFHCAIDGGQLRGVRSCSCR